MTIGLSVTALVVTLALLVWLVARLRLSGADLSSCDNPPTTHFASRPDSAAAEAVLARVRVLRQSTAKAAWRKRLGATRAAWDELFADRSHDARFVTVDVEGVIGEWVLAPGADPARRTLYLHGGGYVLGSARTHRSLTTAFSRLSGGAVLAIDYRLMPEHSRMDGIVDTRRAYRWLLAHGPDGERAAQAVYVAGDSAGGNLALALAAWVRDAGLRAPDAVVALSPETDSTMSSPSMRTNVATDPMLGPTYEPLTRMPRPLLLWGVWALYRINPSDPAVSPVFGDLAGLPPTLVQVSASEMLRDDGRRYVARACAAGSPARLQSWDGMVHVWQLFNPELPEARQALREIGRFLAEAGAGTFAAPAQDALCDPRQPLIRSRSPMRRSVSIRNSPSTE